MKKIKVVHFVKTMPINGISTVIKNYCGNLDTSKIEVCILSGAPVDKIYLDFYKEKGICFHIIITNIHNFFKFYYSMYKHIKAENYDIIHIHGNSATTVAELFVAWLSGIKIRIVHSHNSTCVHKYVNRIMKPLFLKLYTFGVACSDIAGKWMFNDNPFTVLLNGFDTKAYRFNAEKRDEIRRILNVEDKYVILNVARFNDQKNHPFLLEVFRRVAEERNDAILVLVGDGPNLDSVKGMISQHPYADRIIYYGTTDRVFDLYNAADVFVLPSKYEGLGIVFIEAQINGLQVITSNQVPEEANILNAMEFIELSDIEQWVTAINHSSRKLDDTFYDKNYDVIKKYNIHDSVKRLEDIYFMLTENGEKGKL